MVAFWCVLPNLIGENDLYSKPTNCGPLSKNFVCFAVSLTEQLFVSTDYWGRWYVYLYLKGY